MWFNKQEYIINKEFKRMCGDCGIDIFYTTLSSMNQAEKFGRKCRKCGCGWSKGQTKETNKSLAKMASNVSNANKGKKPWNTGLTTDTDDRMKKLVEARVGYTHSKEVKNKISKASILHWKDTQYRELVIERVKESITDESIENWRIKMENGGYFTPLSEKNKVEQYKQLVWYYTRKNDLTVLPNSEKRGRLDETKNAYHLDHIYSITDGYINNVEPEIIGSIHNLRFIPAMDNQIKKTKSDILLKELKKLYYGKSKS